MMLKMLPLSSSKLKSRALIVWGRFITKYRFNRVKTTQTFTVNDFARYETATLPEDKHENGLYLCISDCMFAGIQAKVTILVQYSTQ